VRLEEALMVYPISTKERDVLWAVVDGRLARDAELGPWALDGQLVEHLVQRLRTKGLLQVPVRGGEPQLTAEGEETIAAC
jgi:hypothetical protein